MSDDEQRSIWDINPLQTTVELTDGKVSMRESATYTGRIRVAKAANSDIGVRQCAWLYIQPDSRDGADVRLTVDQARNLRNALDACIQQIEENND